MERMNDMMTLPEYEAVMVARILKDHHVSFRTICDFSGKSRIVNFYISGTRKEISFARDIVASLDDGMYWTMLDKGMNIDDAVFVALLNKFDCQVKSMRMTVWGRTKVLIAGKQSRVLSLLHFLKNM